MPPLVDNTSVLPVPGKYHLKLVYLEKMRSKCSYIHVAHFRHFMIGHMAHIVGSMQGVVHDKGDLGSAIDRAILCAFQG